MDFSCDQCHRRYSLPDERVQGKTVRVRCKHCQHVITLGPQGVVSGAPGRSSGTQPVRSSSPIISAVPWENEATRAAPTLDPTHQWFAMVQGKQEGPFDAAALSGKVRAGEVHLRTYLWRDGMADWKRASDIPELAVVFSVGPSAAPSPAPPVRASRSAAPAARVAPASGDGDERTVLANTEALQAAIAAKQRASRPARASGKGSGSAVGELFADLDLPGAHGAAQPSSRPDEDPFAAVGSLNPADLPPPGEATAFFIQQAGINRRNPPWKRAAWVSGVVGAVAVVAYGLAQFNIGPKVHTTTSEGQEVATPFFSREGVSALGDLLTGKHPKPGGSRRAAAHAPKPSEVGDRAPQAGDAVLDTDAASLVKGTGGKNRALKALYAERQADVAPRMQKQAEPEQAEPGGLSDEEVAKVVLRYQPAFQSCIEQQLKRNPSFRGTRIRLTATVAGSGVVKQAAIDKQDIDRSDLGECLKVRARRMAFRSFKGADIDVQIPLFLTATL